MASMNLPKHVDMPTVTWRKTLAARQEALLVAIAKAEMRLRDARSAALKDAAEAKRLGRLSAHARWRGYAAGLDRAVDDVAELSQLAIALHGDPRAVPGEEHDDA